MTMIQEEIDIVNEECKPKTMACRKPALAERQKDSKPYLENENGVTLMAKKQNQKNNPLWYIKYCRVHLW
jgi:hypothetical protein